MRLITLLLILVCTQSISAQPFSAYVNVRQEFYAFDNGSINKIDHLIPVNYKIGREAIAYIDNQRNFKIYTQGLVTTINDLFNLQFFVSDHFIMYQSANMVGVIDGRNVKTLSPLANGIAMGDSIIAFYDANKQTLNAYYDGKTHELETYLMTREGDFTFGKTVKASDNIVAYINFNDAFKTFYQNETYTLDNQHVNNFQVGRNTIAYNDINNQFWIFHKGQTYKISGFEPKSYQVGDDIVAFVDYEGYFKIFHDGKMYSIGFYEPRYEVKDFVVAYEDVNGFFKAFHNGNSVVLENYYPPNLQMQYHSLAYVNQANMLRFFSEGNIYDVTNMKVEDVRIDYDVLQYKTGFNRYKIYYKGEEY